MADPLYLYAAAAGLSGLMIGATVAWAMRGREAERLGRDVREARLYAEKQRAKFEEAFQNWTAAEHRAEQAAALADKLEAAREENAGLKAAAAANEAMLKEREAAVTKERATLTALRGELEKKFKALAHDTFKSSQKSFLELAEETFKRHNRHAAGDYEQRQQAIANLLKPMQDSLKRYEENLSSIEKSRHEAYGNLSAELKNVMEAQAGVRSETARLVTALRAQPKTRGRWGEQQLQNVMELAGMSEHVDFKTQVSFADADDKRLMPDAVINLPGGRTIVVDAKTSLSAYLDAVECADEAGREAYLVKHAREIRTHMKQLGAKSYWQSLEATPDFVAMFIPGENFFAAAMERDPDLLEDAITQRVLIVTPTTLVALAKAVAFGWRQQAMTENAREVSRLAQDLYKRLARMGDHVGRTGRGLETAVKAYNAMVGSLERQVLPQARRFQDLKVEGTADDLPELAPIDEDARDLAAKELLVRAEETAAE